MILAGNTTLSTSCRGAVRVSNWFMPALLLLMLWKACFSLKMTPPAQEMHKQPKCWTVRPRNCGAHIRSASHMTNCTEGLKRQNDARTASIQAAHSRQHLKEATTACTHGGGSYLANSVLVYNGRDAWQKSDCIRELIRWRLHYWSLWWWLKYSRCHFTPCPALRHALKCPTLTRHWPVILYRVTGSRAFIYARPQ